MSTGTDIMALRTRLGVRAILALLAVTLVVFVSLASMMGIHIHPLSDLFSGLFQAHHGAAPVGDVVPPMS